MNPETRYCNACGHAVEFRIPADDHLPRHICPSCGHVQYHNPKVIVGVIPEWQDGRILMCRRNIEPRFGLWTFPAGFMEMNETSAAGAAREAREESLAEVDVDTLLMVINVPYVSQVYMIHCGRMLTDHHGPTPESSEVVLMREDEIPWDEIAFPTIWHSLKHFFADRANNRQFVTHTLDLTYKPRAPQLPEVPGDDPSA
ncbi:NUDIX hydrolase [Sinimarinibacterium sp. CAU 1509]|uniref:NUDIX hydrolase n=1 Tax=Sinimarinibacterium sp. CAU 1509 TaxID=2562283 RepID=UPI0010AD956A|nr:NUDIX hydrolase [Sinimarinibacterium sp. CAU 1509]TJY62916.1 NUDIX hydrolase [Sinimarinibacterium sp. CAU 1509]